MEPAREGDGLGGVSWEPSDFAAAFEAALAHAQVRIEQACAAEVRWPQRVSAGIQAALALAASNPDMARTLTNDALAEGQEGFRRYDRMIGVFGEMLLPGREVAMAEHLPEITEKMLVGGVVTLIAQRLDFGRHVELPDLAPEAIQFVLTPYIGGEQATLVARGGPS